MHFTELFSMEEIDRALDEKMVRLQVHPTDNLMILNYTDAAMRTPGAWDNPAVRTCRGLILNFRGEVIARPWEKFFNHGQAEAAQIGMDEPVDVVDKLDGSLGILYRRDRGNYAIATRGSFTSDQALHGTMLLHRYDEPPWKGDPNEFTVLFEIVYPANRIVVDYKGLDDLVLLGFVRNSTGFPFGPEMPNPPLDWPGPVAKTFQHKTLGEALVAPPRPRQEGLVVTSQRTGNMLKIKQEDYVQLHRIVTGLSEKTVWEQMMAGKGLQDLLTDIPDELHGWVKGVYMELGGRLSYIRGDAERTHKMILEEMEERSDRGAYAARAKGYRSLTPFLFRLYDGKDITTPVLKTLKPRGDKRYKPVSEDTA